MKQTQYKVTEASGKYAQRLTKLLDDGAEFYHTGLICENCEKGIIRVKKDGKEQLVCRC